MDIELSIVIVNYNSGELLKNSIKSIYKNTRDISFEIWIVDNASTDGSCEMLKEKFPDVQYILNKENKGFARANNQAIRQAKGKYILLINPDTIILKDALNELVKFIQQHPEAGACGPKILNANGTFQPQCKRGLPTLTAILSYLLKLHSLFPKSRIFGKYFMTYLDPEKINEVDCLSGSCMVVRRGTITQVGLMDEDYFMYGEDIDWCCRIKQSGWKIYYVPNARVIHFGGLGGAQKRPYRSIYHFYRSSFVFYRKHLNPKYPSFLNWLVYCGVGCKFVIAIMMNLFCERKFAGSRKP